MLPLNDPNFVIRMVAMVASNSIYKVFVNPSWHKIAGSKELNEFLLILEPFEYPSEYRLIPSKVLSIFWVERLKSW